MKPGPATVLVIESHPLMREALCAAITDAPGLEVVMQVDSVTKALLGIERIIPDIILLALGNVGYSDMDALIALRKYLPTTPILALTSNEVFGQEQAALKYGAQAVLTKAAPRAELLQHLRELRVQSSSDDSEEHVEDGHDKNSKKEKPNEDRM